MAEKEQSGQLPENDPVDTSAQELLRALRERYQNDLTEQTSADDPDGIFGASSFALDDEDALEEEDEVTRRIMEMFSPAAQVETPQETSDVVQEAVEKAPVKEHHATVAPRKKNRAKRKPAEQPRVKLPFETAKDISRDFEDEVSDTALPDFDDTLENEAEQQTLPDALISNVTDVPTEMAAIEEQVAEPEQQEAVAQQSVTMPDQTEEADALQPDEQTALTEQSEAPVATDSPLVPPVEETAAEDVDTDPMVLAEDEVLMDEFEDVSTTTDASASGIVDTPITPIPPTHVPDDLSPRRISPRPSPLDAAMSAQRKKHESSGSRHSAELRAAENLSEEDLSLLLRLGYENELRNRQDTLELRRVAKQDAPDRISDRQKARLAYGTHRTAPHELDNGASRVDVRREYAQTALNYHKDNIKTIWRLVLTVVFALGTLAVDLSPLYATWLPERWAGIATHGAAHLLGLQLLVFCATPSGWRLLYGLRQLLRMTPEPYSVLPPLLICNAFYDVVMALQEAQYPLLNFPTALMCLALVIGDVMDLRRERIAFSVVSAGENKVVLNTVEPRKKKVVRDGKIVKIINDDAHLVHYSVDRVERVDHYFSRTNAPTPRYFILMPLVALQLLLSIAVTGICALYTGVTLQLLSVMMLTLQVCTPAVFALSFSRGLLTVCRRLQSLGITVLGQGTVDEMARDKMLIFDDTEMLQAKSSTEITVKGSGDPKKYVRYARRLFYKLGGTLGKINTSDLSEDRMDGVVEILRIYPDGVEARLDGRVKALMGSSEFMAEKGLRVPRPDAESLARKNEHSRILYLAFGGQIRLGYEINYRIHTSFEQTAALLSEGRAVVALRSYDPDITEAYLTTGRSADKAAIRVIKPVRFEPRGVLERGDSGIVALKNTKGIATAVRLCERMKENHRLLSRVQWLLTFAGAAASAAMVFVGGLDQATSLFAALLVLLLSLPVWVLTGREMTAHASQAASPQPNSKKTENNNSKNES